MDIVGVRKVIHVKKSPNQKSILLPVAFKNGTDIRSIKIVKPSALSKSPKILMAASNLLQEYKQNELLKTTAVPIVRQTISEQRHGTQVKISSHLQRIHNVSVISDDSMSDPSDNESYKFEDMFVQDDDDDDDDNIESDQGIETEQSSDYPKLVLSNEEKRLLAKEGISLPAHYPLTKHEERELKRIRRKIRNKISAQDSRKRKKEYVDGLEERVKKCTDENQTLLKRIKLLQNQNQTLINQMKKMQSLLTKGGSKTAQPATCLMVLLLSMALIAAPNLKLGKDNRDIIAADFLSEENLQLNRRSLLFDTQEKLSDVLVDEDVNADFIPFYPKVENNDHDYAESISSSADKQIGSLIDFDVDDTVWVPPNTTKNSDNPHSGSELRKMDVVAAIKQELDSLNVVAGITGASKAAKNLSETRVKHEFHLDLKPIDVSNMIELETNVIPQKA